MDLRRRSRGRHRRRRPTRCSTPACPDSGADHRSGRSIRRRRARASSSSCRRGTSRARSEHEICFATYYDITDQVPEEYRGIRPASCSASTANELRQDPQSHHLILNRYARTGGRTSTIRRSAPGPATAASTTASRASRPISASCGSGYCRSEIKESFACIGFGPRVAAAGRSSRSAARSGAVAQRVRRRRVRADPDERRAVLELATRST